MKLTQPRPEGHLPWDSVLSSLQSSMRVGSIHFTLVPCPHRAYTHAEHSGHLKTHGDLPFQENSFFNVASY